MPALERAPEKPPGHEVWSLGGDTMGTVWSVRLVAPPGATEAGLTAAIQSELDMVIALFSPWDPTSEISRFNAAPAGPVVLSAPFWTVLEAALDVADDTDGAADPTLGALVDLWGFGPPGLRPEHAALPSPEEVTAALAVSGWHRLRLDTAAGAALQPGGLRLDLSSIAKGHAVDRVSDALTRLGATSHLIEIGGELRGAGVKPDGQPWWVGLEPPPGAPTPRTVAALADIAVATSGDWRRAFAHDGYLYPHTIDGRTGHPITNGVASVTVFHASAMMADAWATALTVLGPEDATHLATAHGLAAQVLTRTPQGVTEHLTPAFRALMEDEDPSA
ncbi:MAG: FAD:protein FMN transferase [Brevundimonas sp.]|uniref:FAD:protein FMN transferase n=1 Tax=Brevundimonas sp. TaxID=1871086 RepID=UPI002735D84D|nr:FAD:protein FMN transferase [Brevundimonas sp.]MDP3406383.1 FAD:protein FMN transferase [Brevundimonas sp.]